MRYSLFILAINFTTLLSCGNQVSAENNATDIINPLISEQAKTYWYNGLAEISSYKLNQARYGEIREGTSVLIFVTEDFSNEESTKADKSKKQTMPVLKMNHTKNFETGIYPYSIMTSCFVPFEQYGHALKISTSVQEWCGHVYVELIQKKGYEYIVKSYFENENNVSGKLDFCFTEDEIWSLIRIYPQTIVNEEIEMIPSLSYLRLLHLEIKPYTCTLSQNEINDRISSVKMHYPELGRTLEIKYETVFPHTITGWSETYKDGFGENAQVLTSTGERIKTIRSDYWKKNSNSDVHLRKELGLEE